MVDTTPEATTQAVARVEELAATTTEAAEEAGATKAAEAFNPLGLRFSMEDLASRCSSFQITSRFPQETLLELSISTVSERTQALNLEI